MQSISAPIQPGQTGLTIANLQDGLLLLFSHKLIKTFKAPNRPKADEFQVLAQRLKQERMQSTFGEATQQLISYFRIQQGRNNHREGHEMTLEIFASQLSLGT